MNPLSSLSAPVWATATDKNEPSKIKGAAEQFEALMITELLKTSRDASSGGGWMGTGDEDQPGQTSLELGEQQFASMLAKSGGLGMQKFITQGLGHKP